MIFAQKQMAKTGKFWVDKRNIILYSNGRKRTNCEIILLLMDVRGVNL